MRRAPSPDPSVGAAPGRYPASVALAGAVAVTALDAALLALALGGVAALFDHARALALLAVWLVDGAILAVLRPVRAHDPVGASREPAWTLVALFLLPLLVPPVSALGERFGLVPLFAAPALEWAGVGLAAGGFALRVAAMARLGSRFSPLVAVQRDHVLETTGLYARVRHPGYLGAWLACAGSMVVFGSALALPLVLGLLAVLHARIRREEDLLASHFGDAYAEYRARTGALWPAWGPSRRGD